MPVTVTDYAEVPLSALRMFSHQSEIYIVHKSYLHTLLGRPFNALLDLASSVT